MHLLGMLNTKYIIHGQGGKPQYSRIQEALGNAWFVNNFEIVDNADTAMDRLANLNPREKAVVQKKYAGALEGLTIRPDSTATIKLTSYHPDYMTYEYSAGTEQLAVFSEVYYPPSKGWNTYLDGELYEPFTKANYLVRALKLPPGQNRKLEMKFEPKSFSIGNKVSLVASLLLLVLFFGGLYTYFKKHSLGDPNRLADSEIPVITKNKPPLTKTQSKQSPKKIKSKTGKKKK